MKRNKYGMIVSDEANKKMDRIKKTVQIIHQYNEFLDEIYAPMEIGSLKYYPSVVLKKCDKIAYKEGFFDYIESEGIDIDELEDIDTWMWT